MTTIISLAVLVILILVVLQKDANRTSTNYFFSSNLDTGDYAPYHGGDYDVDET